MLASKNNSTKTQHKHTSWHCSDVVAQPKCSDAGVKRQPPKHSTGKRMLEAKCKTKISNTHNAAATVCQSHKSKSKHKTKLADKHNTALLLLLLLLCQRVSFASVCMT